MTHCFELRPYQSRVLDELIAWFESNPSGNPIVSACVGAGKSLMIAELCRLAARGYEYRSRILVLVPSKELLEQNYSKLVAMAPDLKIGIVSASAGRKDIAFDKDVVVATVGSVIRNPGNLGRLDLILVDECHLINRTASGQYRKLISECQRFNPALRVIGWTGTPFRGNGIWLTEGADRLFTDIAARVQLGELLHEKFLSPLVPVATSIQVSAADVGVSQGDYIISQLEEKLDQDDLTRKIASEIVQLGRDRQKWLVFGVTIQHAEHLQSALARLGVAAELITGDTPKAERDRLIRAFRTGRLRCLVNVAVLTTGFDVPEIDLLALVRNTKSPVLYTQIAGRGMRTAPNKTDCLWLDFTDTTAELGPVDQIHGRCEPQGKKKEAPGGFKICEECGASNLPGVLTCKFCGHPFPAPERKINQYSNGASVLSGHAFGYRRIPIMKTTYRSQVSRKTGHNMLKAEYWSGMKLAASEFICLEHDGFARAKAEKWWHTRYAGKLAVPVPDTVEGALSLVDYLKTPSAITVRESGQYPEIVSAELV